MCQQLCKLSICAGNLHFFHIWNQSLPTSDWALVYRSPFTQQNAMTINLELGKYIFNTSNCQSFAVLEKELWNQLTRKRILLTIEYNWIADFNFLLIRNTTVWLFGDYFYLQFPESATIIGTIFAVYFLKILCYFSCWNCWKKIYRMDLLLISFIF